MSNTPFYFIVSGEGPDFEFVECEDKDGRSLDVGEWEPYQGDMHRLGPFVKAPEIALKCAGCQKDLTEGEDTSWCSSRCECNGAVWCVVCWNKHIDKKVAGFKLLKAARYMRDALLSKKMPKHDAEGNEITNQVIFGQSKVVAALQEIEE